MHIRCICLLTWDVVVQEYRHWLLKKVLSLQAMSHTVLQSTYWSNDTHTMTLDDDASLSTSRDCTQSVNSNKGYMYIPLHFFYFAEATSITERSPKRAAVLELKSSSNKTSGRSSPEEVSEMPVLTRVCSPATLPRLKRFRFRPIDGELVLFMNSNLRWFSNLLFSIFSTFFLIEYWLKF